MSKFQEVLHEGVENEDHMTSVALYANFILNTSPGYRPSDAAREAVRQYTQNPERILNRESGKAPR